MSATSSTQLPTAPAVVRERPGGETMRAIILKGFGGARQPGLHRHPQAAAEGRRSGDAGKGIRHQSRRDAHAPRGMGRGPLKLVELQTFCPYKGICSYYDIGGHKRAAWSYLNAWPEVGRVTNLLSFEPDKIEVYLDGTRLHLEPCRTVIPQGVDRGLDTDEVLRKTPTGTAQ
jgi:Domain of unknown function (DUF427)